MKIKLVEKFKVFLTEVRTEGKKVTWPTRKELVGSTLIVVLTVFLVSVFIGLVDFVLGQLIGLLLK